MRMANCVIAVEWDLKNALYRVEFMLFRRCIACAMNSNFSNVVLMPSNLLIILQLDIPSRVLISSNFL